MLQDWQIEELRGRFLSLSYEEQLGLISKIKEAEAKCIRGKLAVPELNAEELERSGLLESLMHRIVKVWQPSSKVCNTGSFVVLNEGGQATMTRQEYAMRLEDRLREAVAAAEEEESGGAHEILTGSPEHNPDLYGIAMGYEARHYPVQIMHCDQMQMLLNRIDWHEPGENSFLNVEDMPSLGEIAESIPG